MMFTRFLEKLGYTKEEASWILYDVGNSAQVLTTCTVIFPLLIANITPGDSSVYVGWANTVYGLLLALMSPILGTVADYQGMKMKMFRFFLYIGIVGGFALALPFIDYRMALIIFVIAMIGYNGSIIFYDAFIVDVCEDDERVDRVSAAGYAWGYIGSCVPFVASLILVLMNESLGISMATALGLAFFLNAAWWLVVTIPLLRNYKQVNYAALPKRPVRDSFRRLGLTLRDIRSEKKIFLYLLAFFFFIDGVYTIIEMATAYGSALGLDSNGLLLALLVTQLVAFPCALIFSKLSKKYETEKLIRVCILAYTGIALFAIQLDKLWEFWFLAVMVGMFQGAIQALSRSYFTKIIPAAQSGEYFGLMDICGKGASFVGTTLVGVVSQATNNINLGVGVIAILFVVGIFFFRLAVRTPSAGEV